jgi:hypothetical protein
MISCLIVYIVAGRTILHPILHSLQRITFDDDPLRLLLLETSYQPFISLFHMMEMVSEYPQLAAIRACSVSQNYLFAQCWGHCS